MLRIPFELLEFAFECFESLSNGSNFIRMLRNPFEWFEFAFQCFEFLSNGSNLHSNGSNNFRHSNAFESLNPFQMLRIWIWMLRIPFEWFEFAFQCFESISNGSNLNSNASNPFRMVRICISMLRIHFEWFEFEFECFQSLSNGRNLN